MAHVLDEIQFKVAGRRGNISKDDFKKHSKDRELIRKKAETEIITSKIMIALNEIKNIFANLNKDVQNSNKDNTVFQIEINKNINSIPIEISKKIASIPKVMPIISKPQPQSNPVGAVWKFTFERNSFGNIISPLTATRVI